MSPKQIAFMVAVFAISLLLVMRMIVHHRLREVYAVMWIIVVFTLPAAVLLYPWLSSVSVWVGIESPLNFAFFMGFVFLFFICLHFSALNSSTQRILKDTVQRLAIIESELDDLKSRLPEQGREAGAPDGAQPSDPTARS